MHERVHIAFKMSETAHPDFDLPWCKSFCADSSLEAVETFSRVPNGQGGENSLLAISLNTSNTIRACKSFIKRSPDSQALANSAYVLFSLGSGLNSIAGVCHGSIVTLMFDETFGQLMTHFFQRDELITGDLGVSFKRPLKTPAVVYCAVRVERAPEGRKTWMVGEIRDGTGTTFAEGRCLYFRRKIRGHL